MLTMLAPIVEQYIQNSIEVMFPELEDSDLYSAATNIKDIYDEIDSIANAVQQVQTAFNVTVPLNLIAGHQYTIRSVLSSGATAECVNIGYGGHISGVRGILQFTDYSVVSTTPNYLLTVDASGISATSLTVTPET